MSESVTKNLDTWTYKHTNLPCWVFGNICNILLWEVVIDLGSIKVSIFWSRQCAFRQRKRRKEGEAKWSHNLALLTEGGPVVHTNYKKTHGEKCRHQWHVRWVFSQHQRWWWVLAHLCTYISMSLLAAGLNPLERKIFWKLTICSCRHSKEHLRNWGWNLFLRFLSLSSLSAGKQEEEIMLKDKKWREIRFVV